MSTTIELLSEQHRAALDRLAEVETGLASKTADLHAFVRFLEHDLAQHFGLEEQALFPVMAHHPQLERGPVAVMETEHGEFRAMVRHLSRTLDSGDSRGADASARAIVDFLHGHIAREDHVLFPLALETLAPAELDEVDERAERLLGESGGAGGRMNAV